MTVQVCSQAPREIRDCSILEQFFLWIRFQKALGWYILIILRRLIVCMCLEMKNFKLVMKLLWKQ